MSVVIDNVVVQATGLVHEGRRLINVVGENTFILTPYDSAECVNAVNVWLEAHNYALKLGMNRRKDSFTLKFTNENEKWSCEEAFGGGWRLEKLVNYPNIPATKEVCVGATMHKSCLEKIHS